MFDISNYPLPFRRDALEPYVSVRTIDYHYDKHLDTYINNLNKLIAGTKYEYMTLGEIIEESDGSLFNNAAQVFNHNFFFASMKPNGGGIVPKRIADAFGGSDKFKEQFRAAAMSIFGSGWAWLVMDGDEIKITTTANADTPARHGQKPLMCIDVWEHAYYLDYQNRRGDFIDAYLVHLVNWEWVEKNL